MSSSDVLLITRVLDFAARRHSDQRRKGSAREPYTNHLAEVAALLADGVDGEDGPLIAAGLLHDTLEDTETEYEELRTIFGEDVAGLVSEVTDDKSLPKAERKRLQIETATNKSERARLIKIADRTSNLRTIVASPPENWSIARSIEYINWAEEVVNRCRGINEKLEQASNAAVVSARGDRVAHVLRRMP